MRVKETPRGAGEAQGSGLHNSWMVVKPTGMGRAEEKEISRNYLLLYHVQESSFSFCLGESVTTVIRVN